MEDFKQRIDKELEDFNSAIFEFTKQSGYIEGTLDTVISMMVELNPEIAMTSDRLVKTFHNVEGICKAGMKGAFDRLHAICVELIEKNSDSSAADSLDAAASLLKSRKGGK